MVSPEFRPSETSPTTFHLEKNEVERLISAGRLLFKGHPEFKAFMDEFK